MWELHVLLLTDQPVMRLKYTVCYISQKKTLAKIKPVSSDGSPTPRVFAFMFVCLSVRLSHINLEIDHAMR